MKKWTFSLPHRTSSSKVSHNEIPVMIDDFSGKKSVDYRRVINKDCRPRHHVKLDTSEVWISTTNVFPDKSPDTLPHLSVFVGKFSAVVAQ